MDKDADKQCRYILFGCFIAIVGVAFSWCLLEHPKISGTNFVSLIVVSCLAGLVISMWPKIEEIAVSGIVIKLSKATKIAEGVLEKIQNSQLAVLRTQLRESCRYAGGAFAQSKGPRDYSINHFWPVYDAIKDVGLEKALASEIKEAVGLLLRRQLSLMHRIEDTFYFDTKSPCPTPEEVISKIESLATLSHDKKSELLKAAQEYKKLAALAFDKKAIGDE